MDMAKYIWSILRSAPAIMMSWGIEKRAPYRRDDMEGLWFHVKGFKHEGWVAVLYNEGQDLFEVRLLDDSGTEKERVEEVYFDCLVDIIDGLIESPAERRDSLFFARCHFLCDSSQRNRTRP